MNNKTVFLLPLLRCFGLLAIGCTLLGTAGCGSEGGSSDASPGVSGGTSTAGSTATMSTYKNVLYTLINNKVIIVDLGGEVEPKSIVNYDAETVYIYQHYLYLAGRNGVTIYDISNPIFPVLVSNYLHARACDPVIVNDGVGYITLRNRGGCPGDINRLEVVDFTDPACPEKITEFAMDAPYGLAKAPDYLAVCQPLYGLTLLDVGNLGNIQEITRYPQFDCFDLLYRDDVLVVTAADGIYQLDATDEFLVELSRIPVGEAL
ncbi:hypothetical protein [Marinagarivorans cellulosilyticus]|uniref:LVIVD repeat-containing protein n=1 Tax=Marinagarivorans cellulosilyticus TaxID=2721545 RepID=A0AAN1WEL5_9GAMM|nr:hypothetical protein [Marinagarivorans cellulosilyticus]BCD96179.1 hypothetical protein MARGE09_P0378 [Marinagarivorans cellulosilyticus]